MMSGNIRACQVDFLVLGLTDLICHFIDLSTADRFQSPTISYNHFCR